jgi:uncharacterized protein (TIGR01777 family)
MPVPVEELFAWHTRPGAFQRLNPVFDPAQLEAREGGLEVGARTVLKMKVGPVWQRWVAVHTAYQAGVMFRDEQQSGPFAVWRHTHRFEPGPDGTSVMHDEVEYALPMGSIGSALGEGFTRSTLERTFAYRHQVLRSDLERHAAFRASSRLTVAVTGGSGLLASALIPFLTTGGHAVRVVGRNGSRPDPAGLEGADVILNLAGAGVADERWSDERKALLRESRIDFTLALVEAAQRLPRPPRTWLQGSAVGVYGERGDEVLTESSELGPPGDRAAAFLAGLCADWETAGLGAQTADTRVVLLRTGLVQTSNGGALAKLLVPFRAGAGGPIGGGRQWQSWVSLEDVLGILLRAMHDETLRGPINLVSPAPVTNAEYGRTLGQVLTRPAVMPLPAFAMRAAFGELAEGALLASQRVLPAALERAGFRFQHATLEEALRFTLGK